jgi:general secretion pathway protein J
MLPVKERSVPSDHANQRGFTLIELLVALAIFAVLSAIGYRSLDQLRRTEQAVTRETHEWEAVARTFARLERDVAAALPRPAINPYGQREPAVWFASRGNTLAFTRSGYAGSDGLMQAPQRLAYRLDGERLLLWQWPHVDAAPRSEPRVAVLLDQVRRIDWRFLDSRETWHESWPPPGVSPTQAEGLLPRAIEVTVIRTHSPEPLTRRLLPWARTPSGS